jgi:hypothetical protein
LETIRNLARDLVLAPLGYPTLPQELQPSATDFDNALITYYKHLPLKVTRQETFRSERETAVSMDRILPDYATTLGAETPSPSRYWYVGVLAFAPRLQVGSNRLNEYLLADGPNSAYVFPNAEPLKQGLLDTMYDYHIGDPYYEEDFVNRVVRWVVGGSSLLSVVYGVGHSDPDRLPYRHLELYKHLVGATYYERLLAVRKTGKFTNADFTIDTAQLESTLEEAKKRSDELIGSMGLVPVTSG